MRNIIFWIKQLFPLTYASTYEHDGKKLVVIWTQWFTKVSNYREFVVEK